MPPTLGDWITRHHDHLPTYLGDDLTRYAAGTMTQEDQDDLGEDLVTTPVGPDVPPAPGLEDLLRHREGPTGEPDDDSPGARALHETILRSRPTPAHQVTLAHLHAATRAGHDLHTTTVHDLIRPGMLRTNPDTGAAVALRPSMDRAVVVSPTLWPTRAAHLTPAAYTRRPDPVQAIRYRPPENCARVHDFAGITYDGDDHDQTCSPQAPLIIGTPDGGLHVNPGDYITRDADGTLARWSAQDFAAAYQPAGEDQ